jgi:hypothetical protein
VGWIALTRWSLIQTCLQRDWIIYRRSVKLALDHLVDERQADHRPKRSFWYDTGVKTHT